MDDGTPQRQVSAAAEAPVPKKRPRFHLSTVTVLVLMAAGFVVVNLCKHQTYIQILPEDEFRMVGGYRDGEVCVG
jgi:hypothetical protein